MKPELLVKSQRYLPANIIISLDIIQNGIIFLHAHPQVL